MNGKIGNGLVKHLPTQHILIAEKKTATSVLIASKPATSGIMDKNQEPTKELTPCVVLISAGSVTTAMNGTEGFIEVFFQKIQLELNVVKHNAPFAEI